MIRSSSYPCPQDSKRENEREDELVLLEQAPADVPIDTYGEVRVESLEALVKVVTFRRIHDRLVVQIYEPGSL